jgi:actin-related protein
VGSYSCKAGYAGDDTPKSVFPSVRENAPSETVRVIMPGISPEFARESLCGRLF